MYSSFKLPSPQTRWLYYFASALVVAFLLAWPSVKPVHAAGTVTVCDESHFLAALGGGGSVNFACNGTITLTTTPDTGIVIGSNTYIDATGYDVTLSGNGDRRIFFVSENIEFSVTHLTLVNAKPADQNPGEIGPGGAIFGDDNSIVTVNDSIFSNNKAGSGGAIDMDYDSALYVTNSAFNNNTGTYYGGGAISSSSADITINFSSFTGNVMEYNGHGGAIYYEAGGGDKTLNITGSYFTNNQAVDEGGAISIYGQANIATTLFKGNQAQSDGGAIHNSNLNLTVSGSTFENNTAAYGGAIRNYTGDIEVKASTFAGNSSDSQGGAIDSGGGTTIINNSTFAANSSGQGGGIFITGSTTTVMNSTFSGNSVVYNTSGGAIASQGNGSDVVIYNSILANSVGGGNCPTGVNFGDGDNNLEYPGNTCNFSKGEVLADPQLLPLADNGGPTRTMALAETSPAIDAGSDGTCAEPGIDNLDQRGFGRPQDGNHDSTATCDIGAFEYNGLAPDPAKPLNVADLIAQLRVTPDRVASNDPENLVTYEFRLKNVGPGVASKVRIEFPLDPQLNLGYTGFANPRAWVSEVTTTSVMIALPDLQPNDVVTGTLTFRPNLVEQPAPDSPVATRYQAHFTNPDGSSKIQASNGVALKFGPAGSNQDVSQGQVQLLTPGSTTVNSGEKAEFEGWFFIPGEVVTAWFTRADGTSVFLAEGRADATGKFHFSLDTNSLPEGSYAVAAYGQRSEVYGSSLLVVNPAG